MRQPRIKVPPESGPAVYHCISRVVGGERLLDDPAKEVLRRQMWELADFCGMELLTYDLLSNHFHLVALVPQTIELTDAELLRRFTLRHPPVNRRQAGFLKGLAAMLEQNGPEAQQWRQKQLAMMGDISQYMKLLKQGFTTWYNPRHDRFGTLWAERFGSELVQPSGQGVAAVAAYIDLNCVRAGLVQDPKDYRFCGYAEAVAGNERARRGLAYVLGLSDWTQVQAAYRLRLFGTAATPREGAASVSPEQLQSVVAAGGQLPLAEVLRCRIRYLSRGLVLGSQAWVQEQLASHRLRTGQSGEDHPWSLPPLTDWGDLAIAHRLRGRGFG